MMEFTLKLNPNIIQDIREAEVRALMIAAEYLKGEADKTAPIEEGTMIRSGITSVDASKRRSAVAYDTPYSAEQHENMQYRHNPGRRAKWLELAMAEEKDAVAKIIQKVLKGEL